MDREKFEALEKEVKDLKDKINRMEKENGEGIVYKRKLEASEEEVSKLKEENKRLRKEKQSADIIKCMEDIQSDLRLRFVRLDDLVHNPGLEHIAKQIFKYLCLKYLGRCRAVSKGWKSFIDNDRHWWCQVLTENPLINGGYEPTSPSYLYFAYPGPGSLDESKRLEPWSQCRQLLPNKLEFHETVIYIIENESFKNLKLFGSLILGYLSKFETKQSEEVPKKRDKKKTTFGLEGHDDSAWLDDLSCRWEPDPWEDHRESDPWDPWEDHRTSSQVNWCRYPPDNLPTPLHFAADQNRLDIFELLLKTPTYHSLNLNPGYSGGSHYGTKGSVLEYAICRSQLEVIQFFMKLEGDMKIDFNHPISTDSHSLSSSLPIFDLACEYGNSQVVALLLKHANELEIFLNNTIQGSTPLQRAIQRGAKEIVKLLVDDPRIDVAKSLFFSITCHPITKSDPSTDIFEIILKSPRTSLNESNDDGDTVFHLICQRKLADFAELIFREAIRRNIYCFNQKNVEEVAGIHYAFDLDCVKHGDIDTLVSPLVEVILRHHKDVKIDLEARDKKGRTPMHYLYAARCKKDVDQFLKDAKDEYSIEFELTAKNKDGLTPPQIKCTWLEEDNN